LQDWPAHDTPRRTAVNAFGVGGTNAHIILEQAPDIISPEGKHSHHLIILSARSQSALQQKQL